MQANPQANLGTEAEAPGYKFLGEKKMEPNDFLICWISDARVLIQDGSHVTCLIVADADSKGRNDGTVFTGTISDPEFDKVLGVRKNEYLSQFRCQIFMSKWHAHML